MAEIKLEGIIYKTFEGYFVLRGFAPIGDLAKVSEKPDSYQRDANEQHKVDIIKYLKSDKPYFPEVTLAYRIKNYEELVKSVGVNKDLSSSDSKTVKDLHILSGYLPQGRDRARQAYLQLNIGTDTDEKSETDKLKRVDGNHRLEPFSCDIEWWYQFIKEIPDDVKNEKDEEKREGWLKHQAENYKKEIEGMIIPFVVIISNDADANAAYNFEARIFHDINFKQLPLRQENSLKILSEIKYKDKDEQEKLGEAYPLALALIDKVKDGMFNDIPWLATDKEEEKTYYRTTCLKIAQLLYKKKEQIELALEKARESLENKETDLEEKKLTKEEETRKKELNKIKENELTGENKEEIVKIKDKENEYKDIEIEKKHLEYKIERYSEYVEYIKCVSVGSDKDISKITKAISSLISVYDDFRQEAEGTRGGNCGNIAMLAAMVYFSLLDKVQLKSFIKWAKHNNINQLTEPDDFSTNSALNLVNMFEKIFESKGNDIFISMQFGDSQSELIYEKILRAIETFNNKHRSIYLNPKPIRIDREIDTNIRSIPDKILEAINNCGLFIADLSSANKNVYHEIGCAMGVATSNHQTPNIILLYKENTEYNKEKEDVDKFIGFNLRNYSQLRFKDYEELVNKLVERLEKHYEV